MQQEGAQADGVPEVKLAPSGTTSPTRTSRLDTIPDNRAVTADTRTLPVDARTDTDSKSAAKTETTNKEKLVDNLFYF